MCLWNCQRRHSDSYRQWYWCWTYDSNELKTCWRSFSCNRYWFESCTGQATTRNRPVLWLEVETSKMEWKNAQIAIEQNQHSNVWKAEEKVKNFLRLSATVLRKFRSLLDFILDILACTSWTVGISGFLCTFYHCFAWWHFRKWTPPHNVFVMLGISVH